MKAENKSFAVAYLGYMTYDYSTIWDYIDSLDDSIHHKLPFLNQIPETNMISNASQGEVYCFIPTDSEAVVEICTDTADTEKEETLFAGSSTDPYLLVCNSRYSADCQVKITDSLDGAEDTMLWYPQLDQYLYVEQPLYANGTDEMLDISPYNEMLLAYWKNMQEESNWDIPTTVELENTTWYWDGYTLEGNYYEYRVTLHENTLDAQWNAGDGETHQYANAEWSLEDGDICVLTIDFGEFAGVRKYNLLIDRDACMMYIAADATEKALTWDSEPQYRFLILD